MGKTTVAEIVNETCQVIWSELLERYMPYPTVNSWQDVAHEYYQKWNFPNCLGSIDGKHIRIKCPPKTGSQYYNYKGYFSINLQAVASADYKFLVIDVGAYGRESDGGVFRESAFFKLLQNDKMNVPPHNELPGTSNKMPYVFVGDEAYPLLTCLLRPYPRNQLDNRAMRIFNYRLSRARRTVECAFGILTSKWKILNKSLEIDVENAITITKSVCLLHNMILTHEKKYTATSTTQKVAVNVTRSNNSYNREAKNIREDFATYFNSSLGEVSWQCSIA